MDNFELKNSLKEQKIPFDEAVRKKLEYLESDDVFSVDNDKYITSMRNIIPAQKNVDPLVAAFGGNAASSQSANRPTVRPTPHMPQRTSSGVPAQPASPQNRQMSMAERIAALRGALYVPKEFQHK